MSSPKKRSVGAAGLGQYPAHFQSKKLKGQAAESTNSVGESCNYGLESPTLLCGTMVQR